MEKDAKSSNDKEDVFGTLEASQNGYGIDQKLVEVLKSKFGIDKLYKFQAEILGYLLKSFASSTPIQDAVSNDLCVYVPTGYGKTLAYVLPTLSLFITYPDRLSLPGLQVLILVPTKELVYQVLHVFKVILASYPLNICVAALTGDLKEPKERDLLKGQVGSKKLRKFTCGLKPSLSGPHVLIAQASRISPHLPPVAKQPSFLYGHLRLLIIDEADRLLEQSYGEWLFAVRSICEEKDRHRDAMTRRGVDKTIAEDQSIVNKSVLRHGTIFRTLIDTTPTDIETDVETGWQSSGTKVTLEPGWKRREFNALMPSPLQKIALTATNVQNYKGFGLLMMKNPIQITGTLIEEQVERISHWYIKGDKSPDLVKRLIERQQRHKTNKKILIFCSRDTVCQWLRRELVLLGLRLDVLSSSRNSKERHEVVKRLRKGQLTGLICTDLASRGLDIDNVGTIIHYELPQTAESYIHRVGRAGRAGTKGRSFALVDNKSEVRNLMKVIKSAQKHRACTLNRYRKLDKQI